MGGGIAPIPPPKVKKAQKPKIQQNAIVSPCFLSAKKKAQDVNCQGGQPMLFFNSGVITGPVLDQYWGSTGPVLGSVLGQYWASTGPVLDQYWGSTGPVLYQYWGQCCISTGASTGASTGPVLGSVLDQYWTSSGVSTVAVL